MSARPWHGVAAARLRHAAGRPPHLVEHTLATGLPGGPPVVPSDLDNDGRPDIVAIGPGTANLTWYEDKN